MNICVQGLWHLGSVTAACLAAAGHQVIGFDAEPEVVDRLSVAKAPLFEPGLDDLIEAGIANGNLRFTTSLEDAAKNVDLLWVAYDTPVDDDDVADVNFVFNSVKKLLPFLRDKSVILISSQMPVGSTLQLEKWAKENISDRNLYFAYSPENLRLGKALDVFQNPDRIIVGVNNSHAKELIEKILLPITSRVEWMSIESAEMTKHAINAFLATSVTFANEIASICELVGADAKEVERGLKTEARIGPKAYLSPGGPFAGGTLARDIEFLGVVSKGKNLATPLLSSVRTSNDEHKNWARRKLLDHFGSLEGRKIAIWGLTYKPDTDTLRRSLAIELCNWLVQKGAQVHVFDPVVKKLPNAWDGIVTQHEAALSAVSMVDALVVGTEWPEFKNEAPKLLPFVKNDLLVIDPNRYLNAELGGKLINYRAVGSLGK
jgi:UDPglucose 6-dehydrogenase